MKEQKSYVPPPYIPLGQSDAGTDADVTPDREVPVAEGTTDEPKQWSSGICACFDDMPSCCVVNTICCMASDGLLLGLPGCFVSCYACGYRRALRAKHNLQEAPCGDFVTHFFCHMCAICQEYREIRERTSGSNPPDMMLTIVTAPSVQTMESALTE